MQRFSSARDPLFVGLVVPILMCCMALTVVFAKERAYLPLGAILVLDGFILWISILTYYEFGADSLTIVSGPFRWKVKYEDIHGVIRARDATAAPALARNRLAILLTNGRRVLISPSDESLFLKELQKRNRKIDLSRVW